MDNAQWPSTEFNPKRKPIVPLYGCWDLRDEVAMRVLAHTNISQPYYAVQYAFMVADEFMKQRGER